MSEDEKAFLNHFDRRTAIHATIVVAVVFGLFSVLGIASTGNIKPIQRWILAVVYWFLGAFGWYEVCRYRHYGRRAEHLAEQMAKQSKDKMRHKFQDPEGAKNWPVKPVGIKAFREPLIHVVFVLFLLLSFIAVYLVDIIEIVRLILQN